MSVFHITLKKRKFKKALEHVLGRDADADLELLLDECRKTFKEFDEELIIKAFHWCVHAHRNTMRKSGDPYYTHPVAVARILINEIPFDILSVAAALLHDVLDENDIYTIKDIRSEFGSVISDIVDGIVKIEHVESQKQAQDIQIENYHKLLLSLFKDVRIIIIKIADRLHNMRTLEPLAPDRQQQIARETMDIYCPFAHRIGLANIKWELEDLCFKYLNKDVYNQIKESLQLTRREREEYIKKFCAPVKSILAKNEFLIKNGISFEVNGRAKHIYSIYHKMVSRGFELKDINDLFAIRIIIDSEDKNICFYIYGIICELFPPVPGTFKNYIYMPKKNGYQSIHTVVVGPDDKNVEVQIRTRKMHELSEYGLAAHFRYKSDVVPTISVIEDDNIQKWMDSLREIFDNIEEETPHQLFESISRNLLLDDIYVFTPARELKKLPKESTPLDFAFSIHSEIGYHCIGAKVNGRIVPLDYKLRNGDQVEILTSEVQTPTKDWYNIVITSRAKAAIIKYLKETHKKYEEKGKLLWYDKLINSGINISNDELEELLKTIKFDSASKFFHSIGKGEFDLDKTFEFIKYKYNANRKVIFGVVKYPENTNTKTGGAKYPGKIIEFNDSTNNINTDKRFISSVNEFTPIVVTAGRCCYPLPGDKIIGIVSDNSGFILHRRQCNTIQDMLKSKQSNLIELTWDNILLSEYFTELIITADSRDDILNDITIGIISIDGVNIKGVSFDKKEDIFSARFTLKLDSYENLPRIIESINKINGIRSVSRNLSPAEINFHSSS